MEKIIWIVLPSLITIVILGILNKRLFIRDSGYYSYKSKDELKNEFLSKDLRLLFISFISIPILTYILAINNFTHFGNEKITFSKFFQISDSFYNYEDVIAVKSINKSVASNGNIVEDKHFIIDFSDNNKWTSRPAGRSNYQKDVPVIDFVLNKIKLDLISLEFDE